MASCQPIDATVEDIEMVYEMVDELGAGASAAVYLAKHRATGKMVAIKVFDRVALEDKETADSVQLEVELLRNCGHRHIVRLEEVVQDGASLAVVMEALGGGELFERLKQGALPEEQAVGVFAQVACAVSHLHSLGVVHRDIKPENVMFDALPGSPVVAKLIDMGSVARCDASGGGVTGMASTPHYVAPEVVLSAGFADAPPTGAAYTKACDLWSLGVLLYVMLSKALPFSARGTASGIDRDAETLRRVVRGTFEFVPPRKWAAVSAEAKECIGKLLVHNPAQRLTMGELWQHRWCAEALAAATRAVTEDSRLGLDGTTGLATRVEDVDGDAFDAMGADASPLLVPEALPAAEAMLAGGGAADLDPAADDGAQTMAEEVSIYLSRHCLELEEAIGRAVSNAIYAQPQPPQRAIELVAAALTTGSFSTLTDAAKLAAAGAAGTDGEDAYEEAALRALQAALEAALDVCLIARPPDPVLFLGLEMQKQKGRAALPA